MALVSEALHKGHVTSSFNSGVEPLDRWLRESAGHGNAQDTGRTFVWHQGDGVVVACYTLAGHVLHRDNLSRTQARSLPAEVPAILLAKLALDTSLHSQGLGAEMLVDALTRCVQAGQLVASRYVVVDAINDGAAAFYRRYNFSDIPTAAPPARLLRRLRDIAADLEV